MMDPTTAQAMALWAGMAPTDTNAELMRNLCYLGGNDNNGEKVFATVASSPQQVVENAHNADENLQQMIHLSMGLPPSTSTTKDIFARKNGGAASEAATNTFTVVKNTDDADDDLQQMIHLSMGLPPATTTTRGIFATAEASQQRERSLVAASAAAAANANDIDEDLQQMIHLSMGLPPGTTTTKGIFARHAEEQDAHAMANANTTTSCYDDEDTETLRQMCLMIGGLPPTTRTTRRIFGDDDPDDEPMPSMMAMAMQSSAAKRIGDVFASISPSRSPSLGAASVPANVSPSMMAQRLSGAVQQLSSTLLLPVAAVVSSVAGGGKGAVVVKDRTSPEAIAARTSRRQKAQAPSGIPEELLGY